MGTRTARSELHVRRTDRNGGHARGLQAGREGVSGAARQSGDVHGEAMHDRAGQQLPHSHELVVGGEEPFLGQSTQDWLEDVPAFPRRADEVFT